VGVQSVDDESEEAVLFDQVARGGQNRHTHPLRSGVRGPPSGVPRDRIYVDKKSGATTDRSGPRAALISPSLDIQGSIEHARPGRISCPIPGLERSLGAGLLNRGPQAGRRGGNADCLLVDESDQI
jgi:hypothetical protein